MLADASSSVCSPAKPDALVRGAAKRWLLGLLGIGIGIAIGVGVGVGIELGWLDHRFDNDTDTDTDTDDQVLSV
jgi:hypothetical protein